MSNQNPHVRFEIAPINPGWIKRKVPANYADDGLKRIVMFYVINTPCCDLSSSSLPIQEYGWGENAWKNNNLKSTLLNVANLEKGKTFISAKSIDEVKKACEIGKMKKDFHKNREVERVVFYKPKRYNEFIALCYHIRNALAHGRLAMYPSSSKDIVFALEDGVKKNGEFQVRSRMILKKSTLLRWIDIIERKEQ